MTLGIGEETPPDLVNGAMFADASQHVLQGPALGHVIMHVVGRDEADAKAVRKLSECRNPPRISGTIKMVGREIERLEMFAEIS